MKRKGLVELGWVWLGGGGLGLVGFDRFGWDSVGFGWVSSFPLHSCKQNKSGCGTVSKGTLVCKMQEPKEQLQVKMNTLLSVMSNDHMTTLTLLT